MHMPRATPPRSHEYLGRPRRQLLFGNGTDSTNGDQVRVFPLLLARPVSILSTICHFRPPGYRAGIRDKVLVFGCEGAVYGADL